MFFVGVLKITDKKSSIRSRDPHLDPLVKGTDARSGSAFRIHTKMSRIRNTDQNHEKLYLKGQCHEIFASGFFHESVSPKPLSIPLGPFRIFRKFAEIFAAQGWPPVSTTPVANLPPLSTTPAAKLPPVSTTPVANLPPVSTTPAANFATSFTSVVDTGGKMPPVSTTPAANLPPVSSTPVANSGINIRLQIP